MPAAAVARRTPAMTGMLGTFLGARGETEEDIARRLGVWICRWPGMCPAIATFNTIGVREATANSYFFAGGAILLSDGLASAGLAGSAGLASAAGLSIRSTLASARSLAT